MTDSPPAENTKKQPWEMFHAATQSLPFDLHTEPDFLPYKAIFDKVPAGHILQIDLGMNVFHSFHRGNRHAHHYFAHVAQDDQGQEQFFWGSHDDETKIISEKSSKKLLTKCENNGRKITDDLSGTLLRELKIINQYRPVGGDDADIRPSIAFWDIDPKDGTRTRLDPEKTMQGTIIARTVAEAHPQLFLESAIYQNKPDAINRAIMMGADINGFDAFNHTPLKIAFDQEKQESFDQLVKGGANPNLVYGDYGPILAEAIIQDMDSFVSTIIQHPDIDMHVGAKTGDTALHYAVRKDSPHQMELLLSHPGTDPNCRDNNQNRPIDIAAQSFLIQPLILLIQDPRTDLTDIRYNKSPALVEAQQDLRAVIEDEIKRRSMAAEP